MTEHEEILERLDWLVRAMKVLLDSPSGYYDQDDNPVWRERLDVPWEPVTPPVQDEVDEEVDQLAAQTVPVCTHNQQVLVKGVLQCAKCGFQYGRTGVGNHVAGSGTREGQR